ncbi:MAG: glycosyl hydrolase family 88 [Anaerolineaceae bacterium]|nr:MAG: glycosyl hydrolase family 88 [Anaerolineaceae bacterium]
MKIDGVSKFIKGYLDRYRNFKDYWNYEDGCILMGCVQLFKATGDAYYKEFVIRYMEDLIHVDGKISNYKKEEYNIDSINAGKVLFFLYEETGDERYRLAIDTLMDQLATHPRTGCGNFWHKKIYPNQIWLDGLYMAQPFYMAYETKFNQKQGYNDIIKQFDNVRKYMYNEEKGLYYHAFDEAKIQHWANKETGLSANFWLRSMGWYLMALIDTIDEISIEIFEHYKGLEALFKEAVKGILQYQDKNESKLFYQVIDRADIYGNYLETSGTAMIAYSILKGCQVGVLSKEKYQKVGEEILLKLIEHKLIKKDGRIALHGICSVAGLGPGEARDGSVTYYLSEKVVCDDPKGVGPFMMAYASWLMLRDEN